MFFHRQILEKSKKELKQTLLILNHYFEDLFLCTTGTVITLPSVSDSLE